MQTTQLRAALVASPGMGHVVPILELGKRLLTHHGFQHITVFVVTTDVSLSKFQTRKISQNPNLVLDFVPLDVSGEEDPSGSILTKLATMMREALPKIRSAILALEPRPRVLVVDLLGTEALGMAGDLGMTRKYVLVTTSAWFLALTVYMASLEKEMLYYQVKNKKPLLIPGCTSVQLDPVQNQGENQDFIECLSMGAQIPMADGILLNTWQDMEPVTLGSFMDPEKMGRVMRSVPVHTIGPLVRPVELGLKNDVLDWLDLQPKESVLYVSFGSGGTLSAKQTAELAWGLELSRQRFVWVVRPPIENNASAAMFKTVKGESQRLDFLPQGFLDRTREIGLVVPTWAPQAEILAHQSIGGFLTHCGWNSTLESVVNGVPMVVWPLYAEQRMNGWMLWKELGIAVGSTALVPSESVVRREEIQGMVKKVMEDEEGNERRKRVKELKKSAEKALSEGGSSYISLSKLAMA